VVDDAEHRGQRLLGVGQLGRQLLRRALLLPRVARGRRQPLLERGRHRHHGTSLRRVARRQLRCLSRRRLSKREEERKRERESSESRGASE
jgi:hypothetical protein